METKHTTMAVKTLEGGVEVIYTNAVEQEYPIVFTIMSDNPISNVKINNTLEANINYGKSSIVTIPTNNKTPGVYYYTINYTIDGYSYTSTIEVYVIDKENF
ncbi:MAG: hypothetical protein KatS3mg083_510 [Candidatus Dojkabacteria bacterium]|nr:MAG: hypothetical protein KatS3mg083_510 [Candidatus Dojkabacteria bacterium]